MRSAKQARADDPVQAIMVWPVATASADATLREVAQKLAEEEVGVLLVREGPHLVGLISERDVVRALAGDADPDLVWAADVMTLDTVWVGLDEPIADAAKRMLDAGVRHLPVGTPEEIVGMISIRDALAAVLSPGGDRPPNGSA